MVVRSTSLRVQIQRPTAEWVSVGWLDNRLDINQFRFDPEYWRLEDRPVLGQVFEDRGPNRPPSATSVSLPRWFSHLLPEGYLRSLVAQHLSIPDVREFLIIEALGVSDLPGAVRVLKDQDMAAEPHFSLPESSSTVGQEDPILKFSLAGVQMKYSVVRDGAGLSVPARGQAGNVILKISDFRHGFEGVPEAEHVAMETARAAGIKTAATELVRVGEVAGLEDLPHNSSALAVERFDRVGPEQRVHAEHFGQIFDISSRRQREKYEKANFESIAKAAVVLGLPGDGVEVLKRVVFNILIGNGDAHIKNWALTYPDGRQGSLSPAYDIVPTVAYIPGDNLGLNVGGTKSFADVTVKHFQRMFDIIDVSAEAGVPLIDAVIDAAYSRWSDFESAMSPENFARLCRHRDGLSLAARRFF